ncbi:hypothetical protein ACH4F6_37965 [Streptomyces sp. NPDC017936]|uniref:hypothetical protein n=1 Tax=Streptomyces sp. NPDC017936 TaxID=3365016 RepID=UPI0037ADBF4F
MDLSQLPEAPAKPTGEDLRPLATGQAHIDIYTAFRLIDEGKARQAAHQHAVRAAQLQADGAPVTTVFKALACAEGAAPDDTRPWHAARVDAWAEEHGIRGWHRRAGLRGRPYIAADRLRLLAVDGDRGRYYTHHDRYAHCPPLSHWVIDRDTGRTVYRTFAGGIAQQWVTEHETPAV